eukprot:XP_011424898.1 PREDICTED: uncharacterized protein LOC105326507 [Crassostrea gigas]
METASSTYRVHQCSKCPGDNQYYCDSCQCDLCQKCKENHVNNLKTIDHDVVVHRDKIDYIPTQEEYCVRHPSQVYKEYCEPCQVPVCNHCRKHRTHRKLDVRTAYKTKQQQHRGAIHTIRSEALFYRPVLLTGIKADVKTCHTEFSLYQSEMLKKAQTLRHLINKPAFTFSALQFLSSIKTALSKIHLILHTSKLSMTESLNNNDVVESLSKIKTTDRGKRGLEKECLLKLMSERTDSRWKPQCVYWSPFTGDLLVGMCREELLIGKVTRYNQSGQLTQTIEHDNTGLDCYFVPNYIAENNNGDVVVSDNMFGVVVVTERGGRHRFSYTGPPSGSGLRPCGICTDALSHILVCDDITHTVQMIDRNGQFLSHLLIRPSGVFSPHSLSYDVNTHRLWVGSFCNNKVLVYRYINRHDALTDPATAKVMESLIEIQTTKTKESQKENECQLQRMSADDFYQSLTIAGVSQCSHISCVTSDRLWISGVSDLILKNLSNVLLHRVNDPCSGYNQGIHTLNSESELIYINKDYYIKKLSKNMETTTTFIESTEYAWKTRCVYWSPSTGDLLVGMYRSKPTDDTDDIYYADDTTPRTGKVTRYNQKGQLTQTIQYENKRLELYRQPNYITENNNGDVVVSDYESAVVVTERGGKHRFSYTGHPPGSNLGPLGICTNAMSHILVCCQITETVQVLDKNGQFLFHLLEKSQEMGVPRSMSYDGKTHRLWVGSSFISYIGLSITEQDNLQDEHTQRPDVDILSSSTPAVEWR